MIQKNSPDSFAIHDVRVFDGRGLTEPRTVFVDHGLLAESGPADHVIHGAGGTLLPGLIDSHIHLDAPENLGAFAHWGVTTGLDMGTNPKSLVDSMRNISGLTDIRSAVSPASGPGGLQTTMNTFAPSTVLFGPEDAPAFIADRVSEGCDYVKIIIEDPADKGDAALGGETIAALVVAAHAAGFLTVAHASSPAAIQLGVEAGVDILTHVPLRAPVSPEQIAAMVAKGTKIIPTL